MPKIIKIKSRWDTSHECEMCNTRFAGEKAALVELNNGEDRIICNECSQGCKGKEIR